MTQHNIKPCINNAKIMQNQSRKKCSENAKTSHQRMPWNAKNNATKMQEKPHMCPLNKCKTKHKNIKTNTHTKTKAKTMQQKCTKNAKQMQSKSKTNTIKNVLVFAFAFFCFVFAFLFSLCLYFLGGSLRKRTKNAQKMQATDMQNIAHKTHKHRKIIAQKRWCVKFGCACAFCAFCSLLFYVVLF